MSLRDDLTKVVEHVSAMNLAIERASADPEVADLRADMCRQRSISYEELARMLSEKRGFNPKVSVARAADILYTLFSTELHRLLVLERGWSAKEWRAFIHESVQSRLFRAV